MSRTLLPAIALIAGLAAVPYSHPARADVRHCVTADGQSVFTDRECHQIGATEQAPRSTDSPRALRPVTCARSVDELAFEITMAIDARDTNRLANVFHWAGMSSRDAFPAWQRLDAIAKRPLADIVPVVPEPPPARRVAADDSSAAHPATPWETAPPRPPTPPTPQPMSAAAIARTPVALRLEQTIGDSAHPASTTMALVRHFDCWWVRF